MPAGTGAGTVVPSPTTSVLTMLANALMEIGVLAQGETASANDAAFALSKCNRMLSSWNTRRLYCYYYSQAAYTLPVSSSSYTIGRSGAQLVADRPVKILAANMLSGGTTRYPLSVLSVEDSRITTVSVTSSTIPEWLYYQATYPNGTIWLSPYPTDLSNLLELFTMAQLSAFTSTADAISLPPGYEDAITYSLAESMCPAYGRQLSGELAMLASKARNNIQSLNAVPRTMATDIPSGGDSTFDYLTGNLA